MILFLGERYHIPHYEFKKPYSVDWYTVFPQNCADPDILTQNYVSKHLVMITAACKLCNISLP